jgi:hypothetical protein
MKIHGTVRHINLSGGFWGIEADNGQKYAPVGELPEALQEDGLRVKAEVSPVQVFSIMMWGEQVQIDHIDKL